ncbi:MAG TPA: monovalent cation/H(+) antiporter subunit G [Acidimicrobiales bacterium]|nr:monovalent cation/H(+) antiporter subunit G [Acidimicrobiales bacterium]
MTGTAAGVLLVLGAALTLVAAIGLHRFRDVFARSHAAGKVAPLGAALVFAGVGLQIAEPAATTRLLLAVFLLSFTFPVGVHMVLRAAYRTGTELTPGVEVDELAEAIRDGRVGEGHVALGDVPGDAPSPVPPVDDDPPESAPPPSI